MFPLYDLNPHRRFPWVTVLIIVVNVAVMAADGTSIRRRARTSSIDYGFIPKRVTELQTGKPVVGPHLAVE